MYLRVLTCAVILVVAMSALPARAAAVSYTDALPLVPTNSTRNLNLQKFDPSLGTLQSIELTMSGRVEGVVRFESRDTAPRTINMDLSARLELRAPDSTTLGFTTPLVSIARNATAYDGILDFGGTSGETIIGLSVSTALAPINLPIALYGAMFTGLDLATLPVVATGQSTGSGGGNVIFQFTTLTSADATVTYTYTPVPEPTGLAPLFVGVIICRRRRR